MSDLYNPIQVRYGVEADRALHVRLMAEPLWSVDKKRMYVGDGVTPGGVTLGYVYGADNNTSVVGNIAVFLNNTGDQVGDSGIGVAELISAVNQSLSPVAISGSYNDLINKPAFAPVALSGSYNDLVDKPSSQETVVYDAFVGDGVTTVFTLSAAANISSTIVIVGTLFQYRDSYSLINNGTQVQFTEAPALGVKVACISGGILPAGVVGINSVDTDNIVDQSVTAAKIASGVIPTNLSQFNNDAGFITTPPGGGSGAMVAIQEQYAANLVASIDFTTGIEGQGYKALVLYCTDIHWTVNHRIALRYKIGGVWMTSGYAGDWFGSDMQSGNNDPSCIWIARCSAGHKFASTVTIINPSGNTPKYATAVTASSAGKGGIGHGYNNSLGEIQGIQIVNLDAGTLSGTFILYGVK